MLTKRKIATAAITIAVAIGVGHVMQRGDAATARVTTLGSVVRKAPAAPAADQLGARAPAAPQYDTIRYFVGPDGSQRALPRTPLASVQLASVGNAPIARLVLPEDDFTSPPSDSDQALNTFGLSCEVVLTSTARAAAMVRLKLDANCRPNTRVVIEHEGLRFAEITSGVGMIDLLIPVLTERGTFTVTFPDGESVASTVSVPSFSEFDRAALQWSGEGALSIQALEFGSEYGGRGHVSAETPRDALRAERAKGGFLTRLGNAAVSDPMLAEIYVFPSARIARQGTVRVIVEAKVTPETCGKAVEAQALQTDATGLIGAVDLTLAMPECDSIGDILVLKNLLRDMKIAQN